MGHENYWGAGREADRTPPQQSATRNRANDGEQAGTTVLAACAPGGMQVQGAVRATSVVTQVAFYTKVYIAIMSALAEQVSRAP